MINNGNRLIKHSGQVFTPRTLVQLILDIASYTQTEKILRKHVIDNSCGDGAFLCEIVERYILSFFSVSKDKKLLCWELSTYIHGIELEPEAYRNCIYNLNLLTEAYGLGSITWDIIKDDALTVNRFDSRMDYVVGNPPYVRVHHLEENYTSVKRFNFAQGGMTDLYLVFYELGLQMLSPNGRLCYITPSSWLSSLAASNMRRYILSNRTLSELIDLGHFQAFENATTYTMIALFENNAPKNSVKYYLYNPQNNNRELVDSIPYSDLQIGDNFYVGRCEDLEKLRAIRQQIVPKIVAVKNGFATLADNIFIRNVDFDELTIPVIKASTGKWCKAFFPYDKNGKPLPKENIFSYPEVANYLNQNKSTLLKGKEESDAPYWYLYGRTQALKDVYSQKYSINSVVRDKAGLKLHSVPAGAGLYSGLYILTDVAEDDLKEVVLSEDFIRYVRLLKNYKSGGYYTYSSRDLEVYLNYKLNQHNHAKKYLPIDQCGVFEGYL